LSAAGFSLSQAPSNASPALEPITGVQINNIGQGVQLPLDAPTATPDSGGSSRSDEVEAQPSSTSRIQILNRNNLLWEDQFDSPYRNGGFRNSGGTLFTSEFLSGGGFRISRSGESSSTLAIIPHPTLYVEDFAASVRASMETGGFFSLVWYRQPNPRATGDADGYYFHVNPESKQFEATRVVGGRLERLPDWQGSDSIKGGGAIEQIAIRSVNKKMEIYINPDVVENPQPVWIGFNDRLPGGFIGVCVGGLTPRTRVSAVFWEFIVTGS
jgi:hypothetical protein